MATGPTSIRIRMYNVGFGDCFLLSFAYQKRGKPSHRHVLIDFGTMARPKGSPSDLMMLVANNIAAEVGDEPFAVVATHRHEDHISGFDPGANGTGPGSVIAGLKPKLIVQPWTEDPRIARTATAPKSSRSVKSMHHRQLSLAAMHDIAEHVATRTASRLGRFAATKAIAGELEFIGRDNIKNYRAVAALMNMGPNDYVHAGRKTRLAAFLPGVSVDVLGPPTVDQHAGVTKQRPRDPDQFWHFQRRAFGLTPATRQHPPARMTSAKFIAGSQAPPAARWCVRALRTENAEQTLSIVRSLDSAMNNTSVVLLFRAQNQSLLFPGDAQIENWEYALSNTKMLDMLREVSVYKVGHHGSLNATPKSLWSLWFPPSASAKAKARRMTTMLSTLHGPHGSTHSHTEVPRTKLVSALKRQTRLRTTLELKPGEHFHDEVIPL